MPGVTVSKELLFKYIGQSFSDDGFEKLCFEFGVELDDVVEEEGQVKYKIDIPANRYDLLCIEGISRALSIFLNRIPSPRYKVAQQTSKYPVITNVDSSVKTIRPFIVTALLENVKINANVYQSIIDLQEKLHHNICRKRLLVAIGVHDFDKLKPPFIYTTESPEALKFQALNQKQVMSAKELMKQYESDTHIKPYLHLIKDEPAYPVIRDSCGTVLSMPPIINGDHSKVTENTQNIFIECTATDLTKANIVLDTLVTMWSQYCEDEYTTSATLVRYSDHDSRIYPELKYRAEELDIELVNETVGVSLSRERMHEIILRMGLNVGNDQNQIAGTISVEIPPTRHDIIHSCDVMEDIAIGYGYSNIQSSLPKTSTVATQVPLNKLTTQLRYSASQAGFTEVLTFALCSMEDECGKLLESIESKDDVLVQIQNPKTAEFQVVRSTLLPGILKTLVSNKAVSKPLKLFEISDVVYLDETKDTGSKNERHLCAVYCGKTPGMEVIHGLLDRIMALLEIPFKTGYRLEQTSRGQYFPGRGANIILVESNKCIGHLGVLDPKVISNFELNHTCSALEISIEDFV